MNGRVMSSEDLFAAAEAKRLAWINTGDAGLVRQLCDAYEGLRSLGWRDGRTAPRDGSRFLATRAGSSGIFYCAWGLGHYLIEDGGELWPCGSVFMWKPVNQGE